MAKGKHKSKKKGKGLKTSALGAGLLGGAATLVANKAVGEVVKDAVDYGARRVLGLHKSDVATEKDLGVHLLRLLDERGAPTPVVQLAPELKVGLLKLLDAVQSLRRARMIQYGQKRRVISLTALGREALQALETPDPKDRPAEGDDRGGGEDHDTAAPEEAATAPSGDASPAAVSDA